MIPNTAMRAKDIREFSWTRYDGERVQIRSSKGKKWLWIPATRELRAHLDNLPRVHAQEDWSAGTRNPRAAASEAICRQLNSRRVDKDQRPDARRFRGMSVWSLEAAVATTRPPDLAHLRIGRSMRSQDADAIISVAANSIATLSLFETSG